MISEELNQQLEEFIRQALHEDVKDGDHTSLACIPADARDTAYLLVKDEGVIAGVALARKIFEILDPSASFHLMIDDGQDVKFGDIAFEITCNSQALLKAERLVLNSMQRMSGISTISRVYSKEIENYPVSILDTRKTTPLIRFLEKWAVRIGGASNYRDGLYDWIMIKDNHIDACGGITPAIERIHEYFQENNMELGITVEVRDFKELEEVLSVGKVTRIMLDNFSTPDMEKAVQMIGKRFEIEASGGITISRLKEIAAVGVDFISVGALTHSAKSLDLSLKIKK